MRTSLENYLKAKLQYQAARVARSTPWYFRVCFIVVFYGLGFDAERPRLAENVLEIIDNYLTGGFCGDVFRGILLVAPDSPAEAAEITVSRAHELGKCRANPGVEPF